MILLIEREFPDLAAEMSIVVEGSFAYGYYDRYSGLESSVILPDNTSAERLAHHNVQVRVPLVPGITDTDDNLVGIFDLANHLGLSSVAFLPYNAAASAKYEWFDLPYEVRGEPQSAVRLEALLRMAHEAGLRPSLA